MLEGSLPTTRLRIEADEFGWVMLTCSLAPIEKPCQLTMPFCVAWLICIVWVVGRVISTVPCTTAAPVGREYASPSGTNAEATAIAMRLPRSAARILACFMLHPLSTDVMRERRPSSEAARPFYRPQLPGQQYRRTNQYG